MPESLQKVESGDSVRYQGFGSGCGNGSGIGSGNGGPGGGSHGGLGGSLKMFMIIS